MRLSELRIGQIARVASIEDRVFRHKLLELGCVPGAIIELRMKAPLGDPLAFELEGYTLSMRRQEAEAIHITLIQPVHV